jgi:hypothetical protein
LHAAPQYPRLARTHSGKFRLLQHVRNYLIRKSNSTIAAIGLLTKFDTPEFCGDENDVKHGDTKHGAIRRDAFKPASPPAP